MKVCTLAVNISVEAHDDDYAYDKVCMLMSDLFSDGEISDYNVIAPE